METNFGSFIARKNCQQTGFKLHQIKDLIVNQDQQEKVIVLRMCHWSRWTLVEKVNYLKKINLLIKLENPLKWRDLSKSVVNIFQKDEKNRIILNTTKQKTPTKSVCF